MRALHEKRLKALEGRRSHEEKPHRFFIAYVRVKDREMESAVLDGQSFYRNADETEDQFAARARAAMGWNDDE